MLTKQIRDAISSSAGTADAGKAVKTGNNGTITASLIRQIDFENLETNYPILTPGGRLTLSASNPVADATNVSTLYYLPRLHNLVPLWNNNKSCWVYRSFSSLSMAVGSYTGVNLPCDVWAYLKADNTIGLSAYYWNTTTARNLTLQQQHGIYYLDATLVGLPNYGTYLGTVYLTGTSGNAKLNDSTTQRHLFNAYNREPKRLLRLETTASWTYSGTSWRSWNNSTANRIEVLDGIGTGIVDLTFVARLSPAAGNYGQISMALDSTTGGNGECYAVALSDQTVAPRVCRSLGLGYHYVQAVEAVGTSASAVTYFGGSVCGLQGVWWC